MEHEETRKTVTFGFLGWKIIPALLWFFETFQNNVRSVLLERQRGRKFWCVDPDVDLL